MIYVIDNLSFDKNSTNWAMRYNIYVALLHILSVVTPMGISAILYTDTKKYKPNVCVAYYMYYVLCDVVRYVASCLLSAATKETFRRQMLCLKVRGS